VRSFIEQHGESRFTPKQTVTAAKYANARAGLILLAHKPFTCFTQLAGVKPPKA